ncbi:MAG: protein kinase [Chloroflexaceae bacterium]|nr:protein kinase [Chloroflexaceae bacterium]
MSSIPQQIGNYILERKIGHGASSEVWLARHAHLERRRVAVKILMTYDAESVERFRREASLASQLHHPNIVQVYDHGSYPAPTAEGRFYCTMLEYVHGSSLQTYLEQHGPLQFADAIGVFSQVAAALDYAHSQKIIHRDVSPGNVLLEQATGRALLADFGIARDPNQKITVHSAIMGTPGYWSPEHTRSATAVTHLSDIYGLGVVLYVMVSGDLPWEENQSPPYRVPGPPPPLRERGVRKVPADVDRVLQTLLALEPARRYQSAMAAAAELERILKRHQSATHVVAKHQTEQTQQPRSPQGTALQNDEGDHHDTVAQALGPALLRVPLTEAQQRAERMQQPGTIAALLDEWTTQGMFRRALLGRLAHIHQIRSHNLYFYRLRVLYEQRGLPADLEEPDYHAESITLEPDRDRWNVALPAPEKFEDNSGDQVILPGSARVVRCAVCGGKGKTPCLTCKGKGRIIETRPTDDDDGAEDRDDELEVALPGKLLHNRLNRGERTSSATTPAAKAEKVLVPCPDCEGQGGLHCQHCDGVGRMFQRKAFRWQRTARELHTHDDLSVIDERWLLHACTMHEIYNERSISPIGNGQPHVAPWRREWLELASLRHLIEQAELATDEHTRIIMGEVTVHFIPVTDLVFDLKGADVQEEDLYKLTIYGFEDAIPTDWRFLNWERVLFVGSSFFWYWLFWYWPGLLCFNPRVNCLCLSCNEQGSAQLPNHPADATPPARCCQHCGALNERTNYVATQLSHLPVGATPHAPNVVQRHLPVARVVVHRRSRQHIPLCCG